jgi:signal transduction histidine kinase
VADVNRLVSAIQDLSLARTLGQVCEIVRHAARELTGADGATFVLRDQDLCYYVDEDAIAPLWKGKKFPMSACISGWAMNHRRAVAVPDIYADARIPHEAYRPTFVKSLAMVPIRTTQPIGAIGNYWATPHVASVEEVRLLQALADSTSVALENIRVYEELEERVRDRTLQLQAANRELEAFSASVSHDLRTPLTSIIGFARLLCADDALANNPRWHQPVTRIADAAQRMNVLIDDLLQLSRVTRSELKRQWVDLADVARNIVSSLGSGAAREVNIHIPAQLPAYADPGLLQIVLENLLANAWKFTSRTPHAAIWLGVEQSGRRAFYVRDNGAGFDMQRAERLFAPFERMHPQSQFPGTGVGLSTVQRVIQRHGGEIWAESSVDQGACFYFTLPTPHDSGNPREHRSSG